MARRKLPEGPAPARARIIGAYDLPHTDEFFLVEAIIPSNPTRIDMQMFPGYTPAGWDGRIQIACPEFYLSEDGERLVGSYLGGQPEDWEAFWDSGGYRTRPGQCCRFAFFVNVNDIWFADEIRTPWGRLRMPDTTPIPERLLRLIWSEY